MEKSKVQLRTQRFEFYTVILTSVFCALTLVSCSPLKKISRTTVGVSGEIVKGIAGISTKVLEDGREKAIVRTFDQDYKKCFHRVEDALKNTGSYIYGKDKQKNLIAVYVSQTDTTPVGVFFKETDSLHTQVEVSSPSTYAKELITNRICIALGKPELAPAPGGLEGLVEQQPADSETEDKDSSPLHRLRPESER